MEFIKIIFDGLRATVLSAITALNGASGWLVISFFLAGILHNVLSAEKFQNHLGNKKLSSIFKATISGMFLPICSCGVFPIGISLYYSGAYLGPVLAFMTSTPIINPIAAINFFFGALGFFSSGRLAASMTWISMDSMASWILFCSHCWTRLV